MLCVELIKGISHRVVLKLGKFDPVSEAKMFDRT